jgi:hypothetical protein
MPELNCERLLILLLALTLFAVIVMVAGMALPDPAAFLYDVEDVPGGVCVTLDPAACIHPVSHEPIGQDGWIDLVGHGGRVYGNVLEIPQGWIGLLQVTIRVEVEDFARLRADYPFLPATFTRQRVRTYADLHEHRTGQDFQDVTYCLGVPTQYLRHPVTGEPITPESGDLRYLTVFCGEECVTYANNAGGLWCRLQIEQDATIRCGVRIAASHW